ncbi:MAG: hypothetical protein NC133_01260 [Prevotella sp.]|nr:hypothetical protein [Prevotella sp.]
MVTNNVRSAEMVYAWNHSAEVVNNPNVKRNYDLNQHVMNSKLPNKNEILVNLTGKRKTMLEGAVFMLNNQAMPFPDLERALSLLNTANNAYSLGAVEAALQTQIDTIRNTNTPGLTAENKTLCLFTLQNMIFALSDYQLKNGKENDYVPKILQDQYQMLLKGSSFNLDWDGLYDSAYSTPVHDGSNPTLANWKFLDNDKIKSNMENLAHYQAVHDETYLNEMRPTKAEPQNENRFDGPSSWGTVELNATTDAEVNRILNCAMHEFNAKNLKDNLPDFFNFVKESLVSLSNKPEDVNYRVLHEVVVSAMHKIVNLGHEQQKKSMMEQQATEERSL